MVRLDALTPALSLRERVKTCSKDKTMATPHINAEMGDFADEF